MPRRSEPVLPWRRLSSRLSRESSGLFLALAFFATLAPAQTLQQAEALWKARRYQDANTVFRDLVAREPRNAVIRVRWGRMFLEHWQADEAERLFDEALELKPNDAGALLGKALVGAEVYSGNAVEFAQQALLSDPKLVEAQELLARLALEDDDKAKAEAEAERALALDANSVQAKAILATMDWLADKKESPWDPHAAKGYETAGHFFMLNRRYEESVAFYRKAIGLDPQLDSARSQLGVNLMRLGRDEEAYEQLKTAWDNGFRDAATANSRTLMDSEKNFVTFRTDRTILKLNKKEADLLRPYFEAEMRRAIAVYEKKYRWKLTQPVQVEVYPDHEDFAVRALGMPGLGALGVTFGSVIAMDSPSGRAPGSFHWASVMWHEMSHVFTLAMTSSHVPRWFTEGIAVHEETAASPEWGDRLGLDEIAAIKNHQLLPVAELDRGFVHPVSPPQVVVSYFEAGKICDYITEKWGWETVLAMLRDFGASDDTTTVIRKELKMEPADFDRQFVAALEGETKRTAENFDRWKEAVKRIDAASAGRNYDDVIRLGSEARDLYPDYVEHHSIYEALAKAYLAKGDKAAAVDQLEGYVHAGGRDPDTIMLLAKELAAAGNRKEAAAVLERLNYIYPMRSEQHQLLGELWLEQDNSGGAIREFQARLAAKPIDMAGAHYDLARAFNLNHQTEAARNELIDAMEIAPGFRPAQKLLLQLSGAEQDEPAATKK
ncbi:MAG: tetratricopeptide repeat protein [Bryobacteraceae bacterium]|jgi:tetratricopeptide (TPR) repeat protein